MAPARPGGAGAEGDLAQHVKIFHSHVAVHPPIRRQCCYCSTAGPATDTSCRGVAVVEKNIVELRVGGCFGQAVFPINREGKSEEVQYAWESTGGGTGGTSGAVEGGRSEGDISFALPGDRRMEQNCMLSYLAFQLFQTSASVGTSRVRCNPCVTSV